MNEFKAESFFDTVDLIPLMAERINCFSDSDFNHLHDPPDYFVERVSQLSKDLSDFIFFGFELVWWVCIVLDSLIKQSLSLLYFSNHNVLHLISNLILRNRSFSATT